MRLAMHLEHTLDDVRDPVVLDAGPSVKAALDTVQAQARIGDLDDEGSGRRVRADVITRTADHDSHVGFWLRLVVEGHGQLPPRMPPWAEARPEHMADEGDDRGMRLPWGSRTTSNPSRSSRRSPTNMPRSTS